MGGGGEVMFLQAGTGLFGGGGVRLYPMMHRERQGGDYLGRTSREGGLSTP